MRHPGEASPRPRCGVQWTQSDHHVVEKASRACPTCSLRERRGTAERHPIPDTATGVGTIANKRTRPECQPPPRRPPWTRPEPPARPPPQSLASPGATHIRHLHLLVPPPPAWTTGSDCPTHCIFLGGCDGLSPATARGGGKDECIQRNGIAVRRGRGRRSHQQIDEWGIGRGGYEQSTAVGPHERSYDGQDQQCVEI